MASEPQCDGHPSEEGRLCKAIGRAALAMANVRDSEEAVGTALRVTEEALGADAVLLWMLEAERGALRLVSVQGISEKGLEPVREVPLEGLLFVCKAVRERRVQAVEDLDSLPPDYPLGKRWLRLGFKSIIAVPLSFQGETVGALAYLTRRIRRHSTDELSQIETLGGILGAALENARLSSERRRAERELRESEEMFRQLADSMPQLLWTAEPDGTVDYYNVRYREFAGIAPEPGDRGEWVPVLHPEDRQPTVEAWQHAIRTGKVYQIEHRMQRTDGSFHWYLSRGVPARDEKGRIVKWYGTATDIDEQKRLQEERERLMAEMRASNERLTVASLRERHLAEEAELRAAEMDATIGSIADGVVIYDPRGEVLRMNGAAQRLLGVSRDEFGETKDYAKRMEMLRVETADGYPMTSEQLPSWRALHGETVQGVLLVIHALDGRTLWASVSAAPIRTPEGELLGAVTSFTDITRLHELQEQQEDMLRTVSHDLRTPLTVIHGQAQMVNRLAGRPGQEVALKRSTEAILTGARRMNSMILDLVDSVRLEAGQLRLERQPVELRAFVHDLKARLADVLAMNRVRVEIPERLPQVSADPNRLERILTNLLSNALKYSPPETEVVVRGESQDGVVMVSVTDRGAGILPQEIPNLFQRFHRVKGTRKAEGLGLGLYITRLLVEAHGGSIWVESEPGKGSTFCFSLPG